jgi:hypothetical protein
MERHEIRSVTVSPLTYSTCLCLSNSHSPKFNNVLLSGYDSFCFLDRRTDVLDDKEEQKRRAERGCHEDREETAVRHVIPPAADESA